MADGIEMSADPELVPPLTSVSAVAQERRPWRAYPLVDHVADKVCAILERHGGRPSTRYKDLIDLVAIVERATIVAEPQARALIEEGRRRNLKLPPVSDVPDRDLWTSGYRSEARRTMGLSALELHDALTVTKPFLDPLLQGDVTGSWDHVRGAWLRAGHRR